MLLFKPEHIDMIIDGTKTQTRRVWKKDRAKIGSIHQVKTRLFEFPHAHIKILKSWKEPLGDISEEDSFKEGQYTIEQYKQIWININGSWTPELIVNVREFALVSSEGKENK